MEVVGVLWSTSTHIPLLSTEPIVDIGRVLWNTSTVPPLKIIHHTEMVLIFSLLKSIFSIDLSNGQMRGLFEKIAFWFHEIFAVKFEFILKPCCLGCLGCLGYLA